MIIRRLQNENVTPNNLLLPNENAGFGVILALTILIPLAKLVLNIKKNN